MNRLSPYYKVDDLFKEGDIIYDKETNNVFKYKKHKHRESLLKNPNNYRVAHAGDIGNKKI
jgi:hypothetical protein